MLEQFKDILEQDRETRKTIKNRLHEMLALKTDMVDNSFKLFLSGEENIFRFHKMMNSMISNKFSYFMSYEIDMIDPDDVSHSIPFLFSMEKNSTEIHIEIDSSFFKTNELNVRDYALLGDIISCLTKD